MPSRPPRQYRYGAKSTTGIVLDAVRSFGRPVSAAEVSARVRETIPDFRPSNIFPDLSTLSVNCRSRGNYSVNKKPRRTDTGNPNDKLIKKIGALYDLYDPKVHGVWELVDTGDKVLRPEFLAAPDVAELDRARDSATSEGLFDPGEDARRRVMAAIVQREGQPAFRRDLLRAYGGACAISGCTIEALLEAAHIVPYRGAHTNVAENGLLLRADLHKLFDLHLICIEPQSRTVRLSEILKNSEYGQFEDTRLRDPEAAHSGPSSDALKHHFERCGWVNAELGDSPLDDEA